jgi:hypothetical protein
MGCIVAIALWMGACTQAAPPPAKPTILPSDHVSKSPVGTEQTVLAKTFNLKGSATFPFEIPAHASQPHLHGIFESFAGQARGPSDETADIEFLIMNEEQQADIAANRPSEALFSVETTHNQSVNFDLPASMEQPVKYYLIFRNTQDSKSNKVVRAQFRVDF